MTEPTTRRSTRSNATASTSTSTATALPSQNLRKRPHPAVVESPATKSTAATPAKASKRRKITIEEVVVEVKKGVKGKGRARAVHPPAPVPVPQRPNHRKRKLTSTSDDAGILQQDAVEVGEAEVEVPAGRRTRKKRKSGEGIAEPAEDTLRKTRAAKPAEAPVVPPTLPRKVATKKTRSTPVPPPTVRRFTRSLLATPATTAVPVTTTVTAIATPAQPPSPALSALSSLPPSPAASPTQTRAPVLAVPPPLSLSTPPSSLHSENTNAAIQRQTDAVVPTGLRSRASSPTPSTRSPLATAAVLEAEPVEGIAAKARKGPKGKGKAQAREHVDEQVSAESAPAEEVAKQGTKRKRGAHMGMGPRRRSSRLNTPTACVDTGAPASSTTVPAAPSPLAAAQSTSSPSTSQSTKPPPSPLRSSASIPSTSSTPAIPPLSLSLAQLSPPQAAQRHQGPHGVRSSPVSPLAPPHENLPPTTPPPSSAFLAASPLSTPETRPPTAEGSTSSIAPSTPSSPTRSPQMTLDRMDFGTINLPSMGSIPALNLGPSSIGLSSSNPSGSTSSSSTSNGKKTPGGNSPRTSPLLRPMVPSALGLGMVKASEVSPISEKSLQEDIPLPPRSPPIIAPSSTPSTPATPPSVTVTPAIDETQPSVDLPPSPTASVASQTLATADENKERERSLSPVPPPAACEATLDSQPPASSPPPPSPLQDGNDLLPQLPVAHIEYPPPIIQIEEQPRPSSPAPFTHHQHQVYPQHYDAPQLYEPSSTTIEHGHFRPSSPAPQQMMEHTPLHHHTPTPHTAVYNHTHSLADALGSPPPSPIQAHGVGANGGVPQLPQCSQQMPVGEMQGLQIQIPVVEGVQQIEIPEATPQELVQVELEAAPQPMQVAAPVPLPVSASTPPPQAYQPVWEEPPRLDTEKNLWKLACKVRVWDLRRRYSPEAIRALVTQEAHEYYEKHGFPLGYFNSTRAGPSSLRSSVAYGGQPVTSYACGLGSSNAVASGSKGGATKVDNTEDNSPGSSPTDFMDEPVYDWEINSNSDDEDDLEAEFDDEDYEDEDDGQKGGGEKQGSVKDQAVKEQEKASEVEQQEEDEEGQDLEGLPRKKRKVDGTDDFTGKTSAPSSPAPCTPTEVAEGGEVQGEKEMEVESDDDEDDDLEEVNTDFHPSTPTATTTEQHEQLDAEAQAEEDARRRDLDEALSDPSFNLELSSPTATSPTALAFGEGGSSRERSLSPSSPSPSPGGAFNAFYVPPAPRGVYGTNLDSAESPEQSAEQDMEGSYQESPAQSITPPPASPLQVHLQMPMSPILEIPPPRLSTVPVWALRSMDMMVGGSMGRGTPVDKNRKMEWITVTPRYSTPMSPSTSSAGDVCPETSSTGSSVKQEHGDGDERDRKPILRLTMPGDDSTRASMGPIAGAHSGSGNANGNPSTSNGSGASEKTGGSAAFEPNDAEWAAFLADLAAGGAQSSSTSSMAGSSSESQEYSQQDFQCHPPPYTPSSSNTLTLPGQHQQQQQHPAFGMNVNMNLTNMFNMGNGVPVSGSPTTVMNFMPMHNMGSNLMNMGGMSSMGNMSMPPLASPMPIGANTPLSSPTLQAPPISPPHSSSATPTPPPASLVNVPVNMFGMGFGGNVQIGGASLQLGLTVSLTPGMGNNVNNTWFGSPPSSPPAMTIAPDGSLVQEQGQNPNQSQGSSGSGSYSSPPTPSPTPQNNLEFDSNGMFGIGQMPGMSGAMGVMSYGHPMNMGVAMGMGNGMGSSMAMGIRDGMTTRGGHHTHGSSSGGNRDASEGGNSAQVSPTQSSSASALSFALG